MINPSHADAELSQKTLATQTAGVLTWIYILISYTLTFAQEINHACIQPCIFTKPPGRRSLGALNIQPDTHSAGIHAQGDYTHTRAHTHRQLLAHFMSGGNDKIDLDAIQSIDKCHHPYTCKGTIIDSAGHLQTLVKIVKIQETSQTAMAKDTSAGDINHHLSIHIIASAYIKIDCYHEEIIPLSTFTKCLI